MARSGWCPRCPKAPRMAHIKVIYVWRSDQSLSCRGSAAGMVTSHDHQTFKYFCYVLVTQSTVSIETRTVVLETWNGCYVHVLQVQVLLVPGSKGWLDEITGTWWNNQERKLLPSGCISRPRSVNPDNKARMIFWKYCCLVDIGIYLECKGFMELTWFDLSSK